MANNTRDIHLNGKFIEFNIIIVQVDLLEQVHLAGYLHCDVKPNNILFGIKDTLETILKTNQNERKFSVYLIDFGLSKRFIEPETCSNTKDLTIKTYH
jgi:serine/threonine protein kinase